MALSAKLVASDRHAKKVQLDQEMRKNDLKCQTGFENKEGLLSKFYDPPTYDNITSELH